MRRLHSDPDVLRVAACIGADGDEDAPVAAVGRCFAWLDCDDRWADAARIVEGAAKRVARRFP